jgi:UDP-2,3-diacylglucosamine pyrophosphatase LpxH
VASDASTCHQKGPTPLRDDKLSFKLSTATSQSHSASRRPERIRSSLSEIEVGSPQEMVKIKCGICQKLLKTKTYIHENIISSSDVSVVAVLVCGHVFHADCLETRTHHVDRRDPPCPLCVVDPPS